MQTLGVARRAMLAPSSTIRDLLAVTQQPGMRSLAGGLPDPACFPVVRLREAANTVLGDPDVAGRALQYGPTDGEPELRHLLAAPSELHGLGPVDADEIVVTTGSQQGLDLLARTLLDPGDHIAVDDPCYLGARQTFVAAGARLHGVPVDHDGMRVDTLERELRAGFRPRFVYTVPNFQNPTGAVLTLERRRALGDLAGRYGFIVVEDDPYHSLSFSGSVPEALGAYDPEHVVTLGSLSKVLAPGLRVGWLRAPAWLREAIVRAKQACDLHTPSFTQLLAFDVLRDAQFMAVHLDAMRAGYRRRADALIAAIAPFAAVPQVRGGMFVWLHLPGIDTEALLPIAIARRVAFVPGAAFAVDRPWHDYARLSFATLPIAEFDDAGRALHAAVDQAAVDAVMPLASHSRA